MPSYYTTEKVTREECSLAQTVWNDVLNNTAPRYCLQKESYEGFGTNYPTAMDYFTYTFFARLFDIHPACRFVLSKVMNRNKFIKIIVAFLLSDFWEDEKATKISVEHFLKMHHNRGVRTVECKCVYLCYVCVCVWIYFKCSKHIHAGCTFWTKTQLT
ncbi:hypothetical protein EON63_04435 [archaeon]|nr:MAG: hypothetical protein EON63_04435 [archaeon]